MIITYVDRVKAKLIKCNNKNVQNAVGGTLKNQIIKIKNLDPNETLLNYIRTKLKSNVPIERRSGFAISCARSLSKVVLQFDTFL